MAIILHLHTVLLIPHFTFNYSHQVTMFHFLQRKWKRLDIGSHNNKKTLYNHPQSRHFSPLYGSESWNSLVADPYRYRSDFKIHVLFTTPGCLSNYPLSHPICMGSDTEICPTLSLQQNYKRYYLHLMDEEAIQNVPEPCLIHSYLLREVAPNSFLPLAPISWTEGFGKNI